ncbi:hypothetical protein LSTR_LSTR012350 [Laodelphax striatellus]|uniref:Uncharacterized protein n=1 Tax=Laodelphax striatellus TaxID=195883 RepID=A0A482WKE5_LAOST|nr:hypothetical protein LSTR_LSTR012350 [Laodelphax striatellus]
MDVSFNNVLESTRQYFQGLPANSPPAAGGGTVGAVAGQPPPQQQQQQPSSSPLSYWPPKATLRPSNEQTPPAAQLHHQHQQPQSHYPAAGGSSSSTKAAPHRPLYNGARTAPTPPSSDVTAPTAAPAVNQRHNLPPIAALTSSYAASRATPLATARLPSISQITPHRASPQQRNQPPQPHHFRSPDYSSYNSGANNRSLTNNTQYSQKYSTTASTASYSNSTTPSTASFSSSPTSVSYSMSSATVATSSTTLPTSAQQSSAHPSHSSTSTYPTPTSSSSSAHPSVYPTHSSSSTYPTSSSSSSAYTTHSSSSTYPTPTSSSSSTHPSVYPTHTSSSTYPTPTSSSSSAHPSVYPTHTSSSTYPTPTSSAHPSVYPTHSSSSTPYSSTPTSSSSASSHPSSYPSSTPGAASRYQQQYNQAALQQQQQMQQHYQNAMYQQQQQQQRQQQSSAEMAKMAADQQHYRNQMAAAAAKAVAGGAVAGGAAARHSSSYQAASHVQQQQHQAYYSSPGNPVRSSSTQQPTPPQQASTPITTMANNNNNNSLQQTQTSRVMKRESPLDLSVKTVRQSADSTAKDDSSSENYHHNTVPAGYHHHEMLVGHSRTSKTPPKAASSRQTPSLHNYPNYQESESNTGAPKVDFLPNFSAPHQNNYQASPAAAAFTPEPKKRSRKSGTPTVTTGQYPNPYQNPANLKKSLPYDYKQNAYYATNTALPAKTSQNRNGNMYSGMSADAAYLLDVKQFQHQSRMDYLNQQALSSNQPPAESNYKRASTTDLNNPRQAKIPKFDQWKQKFDEQIDLRFKSYASSKLMNEQQQQSMNGVGAKDGNSNGGVIQQQNYSVYAQQQSRYQSTTTGSNGSQNQIPQSQTTVTKHPMYTQPRMVSESAASSSGNSYAMNHALYSTAAMKQAHDASHYQGGRLSASSNTGAANKQVLSILRNSLEIREARNLQIAQQQQAERGFAAQEQQQQQQHYQQQQILHHRGKSYHPLEPMLRMQPQATIPGPPPQNTSTSKPPPGVPSPTPPPPLTNRHNLPPFGAIAVDRSSATATPPYPGYKFHLPKAVDSVLIEDHHRHTSADGARLHRAGGLQAAPEAQPPPSIAAAPSDSPTATEMDGLAAFLAARIRTKAELKQVGPGIAGSTAGSIPASNGSVHSPRTTPGIFSPLPAPARTPDIAKGGPSECESAAGGSSGHLGSASSISTTASPPKLTRERNALISPRRLFRSDDDGVATATSGSAAATTATTLPPAAVVSQQQQPQPQAIQSRDAAPRSSSEASVFDFRESDSDGEMPVLERQSLRSSGGSHRGSGKQRRGGGSSKAAATGQSTSQIEMPEEPPDPFWSATCDDFLTQLTTGKSLLKRRGRRKKKRIKTPPPTSTITSPPSPPKPPPPTPTTQPKPDKIAKTDAPPPVKKEKLVKEEVKVKEEKPKIKKEIVVVKEEKVVEKEKVFEKKVFKKEKVVEKEKKEFICDKILEVKAVKLELGESSDEDIPLSKKLVKRGRPPAIKQEPQSEAEEEPPSSDEEEEEQENKRRSLRERKPPPTPAQKRSVSEEKNKEKPRKKQTTRSVSPPANKRQQKDKPKKFAEDVGSKFTPGWEEDLLKYKKSLRMPARLITISRPANWPHRATASLPDLDSPLPSPDMFTPPTKKDDDNEKADADDKSPSKQEDSFLNRLVQRYGNKGKKSIRKAVCDLLDSPSKPKKIEKSSNEPELLPTPRLDELIKKDEPIKEKKPRGRKPKKDKQLIKDKEPVVQCDSNDNNALGYLGYFRKKTMFEYREAFEKHNGAFVAENDLPPVVYESRTRTQTRVLKQQATIREVFGDDRPASAPPAGCRSEGEEEAVDDQAKKPGRRKLAITKLVLRKRGNSNSGNRPGLRSAAQLRSSKAVLNSKRQLLRGDERRRRKRNSDLLKAFAAKQQTTECVAKSEKSDSEILPPPPPPPPLETQPSGKKLKLRRKLKSSGFDYIRKKKKQQRRDGGGEVEPAKEKRKSAFSVTKSGLESEQDIQNEIKGWVINKGLGETVLHRAARLGYTDVVAYCLEKLGNNPSPRDNAGYTPLYEACSRNHIQIARLLLLYGANPSDSAQGGIRLLHEAAENGFVEVMRLLLSFGADPLLATYAGHTPLSLATSQEARALLQHHLADVQGTPAPPWHFNALTSLFDEENSGNDPVADAPEAEAEAAGEELVVEYSEEGPLPNLYTLHDEDPGDRWLLFQEVCATLRIKTRDALLRQLGPAHKNDFRDLKLAEFYDQAHCCMLMSAGDQLVNPRAHKVVLVKYSDQLRALLKISRDTIS